MRHKRPLASLPLFPTTKTTPRRSDLGTLRPGYYEFFAGAGMVRAGLGASWRCLFANDFDQKKGRVYGDNWGTECLTVSDVRTIRVADLPGTAHLAWASFPCQDLSLAGAGAGLRGDRSGTFWPFWNLAQALIEDGRAPQLIAIENVCGTFASHGGKDFATICGALHAGGYRLGAIVVDAAQFVPQSRPRMFVIGVRNGLEIPGELSTDAPSDAWHPAMLRTAFNGLPAKVKAAWVWWNLPEPQPRTATLADLIEAAPTSVEWFTGEETRQLLGMMSPINLAKVKAAKRTGKRMVGGIYKRTRRDEYGRKVQRAEIRFDELSGCLRTPAGGSSRQLIMVVEGASVRARLISTRETARLMGLPDAYKLPQNYNEAYHLTGDGVVVPVVRHLAENIFEPIIAAAEPRKIVAA